MWSQIVTTSLNCLLYPLFNTLAGIVAPCSVNTNGKAILGRFIGDVITICDHIAFPAPVSKTDICVRF